ncbi:ABC transporter ATP-binding protein [Alcanivorax sediminis]|uniref:Dipeptide ABC transporter ATP-binding protein n=1 Tax=Alcanivorax sediminis TaxID=2663008 RepID=A0A6N7LUF8_9GAMM|nr:dipeptide ABC transporter ATP-binding protein [Alcanivorax sediminis]MQX54118.1 dipeptide ABC transporter ATP-binding protein [Alcanivorax sediminis]
MSLLSIRGLTIRFGEQTAVDNMELQLDAGRMLALVGESGSGKSLTALSLLDLLPEAAHWSAEHMTLADQDLLRLDHKQKRTLRGGRIGMIFQEPLTALNPLHTVEKQISESLFVHQGMSQGKARERCLELLEQVELPATEDMLRRYPHQLSGGQRQRVMIAMALANNPEILIADEPTTALDVTVQETILKLIKRLQTELGLSILLISHDLGVVSRFADDIIVMHKGKPVEAGPTHEVLANPKEDYTRHLLSSEPSGRMSPIAKDSPILLQASEIEVAFKGKRAQLFQPAPVFRAVDNISLSLRKGETLGIVGESGSGKSTLALALLRLIGSKGIISLDGQTLHDLSQGQLRPWRRRMQVVFQDPFGSLNPRMTIGQIIAEGLAVHEPSMAREKREERVSELLREVDLPPETRHRYPHEFSGGQRQRIAIARALILNPDLLILDEPTSALDRSVQFQILELLKSLQQRHGLSYLFISHDLKVIRAICHRVMVMKDGKVVEEGDVQAIFDAPAKAYTQRLIAAAFA